MDVSLSSEQLSALGLPEAKTAAAQSAQTRHTPISLSRSVVIVWRDALSTFSARSVAILFCALISFAAPIIIGAWINAQTKLSSYAWFPHPAVLHAPRPSALLIAAFAGVVGLTFARGAITWLALHRSQSGEDCRTCGSFGTAIRMTLARFPGLLASTLFYGAIVTAGIVGLSEWTQPLEYKHDEHTHVRTGLSRNLSDGLQQLTWRGFNMLIPDPGPPFAEFIPNLRHAAVLTRLPIKGYDPRPELFKVESTQTRSTAVWPRALGSVALILFAETLLRFRTVMAMKASGSSRPEGFGLLVPLLDSARFGLRHFGLVTIHIWVIRLVVLALILVFVEFPQAFMDHLVMPNILRFPIPLGIVPILDCLTTSSAALVGAMLIAFSAVYDARLHCFLTRASNEEARNWTSSLRAVTSTGAKIG